VSKPASFAFAGARVLVHLHERELRHFLDVWRRVDALELGLPRTSDPSYASREHLLVHVLACAAGYLVWICEQRGVEPPALDREPDPAGFDARADDYIEQVLDAWSVQLCDLTESEADGPAYASRWGVPYCIDAMLEHAVMHPVRHTHQLEALMSEAAFQGADDH
jgi:uncharacterized damage-inducible protein DinB